ncbi:MULTISPECIES: hypothetical protein [unclassified Methanoregula]|uniref:hypothetical protein n=1 Tax=unclassified Methanoregula TaxID=2649730 RepID=UPI0009D05EF2|nr:MULTISPECIES: hypothetical protein [unclassified Methanoregula]OPX62175.1 MAG: hypothetical protein A4E33_02441 [Methanoregula sp. PtaB.Bin085]OPY35616.1 MAG: hypothetical protein A4E34_00616 [Methanoregula sp. PtaU1.Bin006]
MKHADNLPMYITIAAFAIAAVLAAGCASGPATHVYTPVPTAQPVAAAGAAGPGAATLPYGVTVTVPADWSRQDVMTSDIRDYGRRAVRIATFSSPVTIPGDAKSVNTLSVDIDENPGADFEAYFNQATLALQDYYKTRLDSHSIVKSSTLTVSGTKAYQLDFQTEVVKGYYIFTKTDKGMYILAFRGENKPTAVRALQGRTEEIVKSVTIAP